ncbi:hypothetical protein [Pseudomonas sp. PLMAX]|uniref:hypothetical protein n=1 Tax=Pseudomonas sp. PLMAX TaxID=2201998 RepID=UPI0038B7FD5D
MKKLVIALSVVMLAACGEAKITKVDGTSVTTADQTLKAMGKGLSEHDSITYLVNIRMLHSRYESAEFAKKLDGMDMDEVRKEMASTKAHFITLNRERFVQIEQVHIDKLQQKVDKVTALQRETKPDFDPETHIYTRLDIASIRAAQRRQEEYRTQSDEKFFSIHGCGCETSTMPKTAKFM